MPAGPAVLAAHAVHAVEADLLGVEEGTSCSGIHADFHHTESWNRTAAGVSRVAGSGQPVNHMTG